MDLLATYRIDALMVQGHPDTNASVTSFSLVHATDAQTWQVVLDDNGTNQVYVFMLLLRKPSQIRRIVIASKHHFSIYRTINTM